MRDRYEDFVAQGASVAVIAMGYPAMAQDFRQQYRIPFPVLVDTRRESYKALGLRRGGWLEVLGPRVIAKGLGKLRFGVAPPGEKQDVFQMGGALVLERGGKVLLVHRATDASQSVPADELLGALRPARS